MVKPTTVQIVLTFALSKGWFLQQLDDNNAFLNGDLQDEVYMNQPQGFIYSDSNLVCRLKKSLYGLKQAPRSWFEKLSSTLHHFGFHTTKCDPSLFTRVTSNKPIYVLVYVDDIIIIGSSVGAVKQLVTSLNTKFALKDLSSLNYFLGIQVKPTASGGIH